MKQVILKEKEVLEICETQAIASCLANEVKIQVKAVTICGSDGSYFKADTLPHNLKYPLVLGHEVSGIIVEVGSDVTTFTIGERVAIEPDQYCGECSYCKEGNYNFCESLIFMASKGATGALQEYINWPAYNVYKLHETMSFEDGALLEPLSVAYSAIEKLQFHKQSHLVILGAGSIGILMGLCIQALYPNLQYHIVDQYEEKKLLGEQVGIANHHFLIGNDVDKIENTPFTHMIDTTGSSLLIKKMLRYCRQGSSLVQVGVSEQSMDLSCKDIVYQGIHLIGSYRYANTYPKLLTLLQEKNIKLDKVISKHYTLQDVQEAFEQAIDTKHNIKVAIMFE